jgi:hypothetical protein
MDARRIAYGNAIRTVWSSLVLFGMGMNGAFAAPYFEVASGDLSGDRLSPTLWNLSAGVNSLVAGTSPGDQEYLRVDVPANHLLRSIGLQLYSSSDAMFIGVQQGTTFTVTPQLATAADMYGYAHFGTSAGNVGTNILDDMGLAAGAAGFTPPLVAGSYTFWLQQGTPGVTNYRLDFDVFRPGDYNSNGQVDAADYTVWRNTVGSTTDLRADGSGPGGVPDQIINSLDYAFWKQMYSGAPGSGGAQVGPEPVPEPPTCVCVLAGLTVLFRRRSARKSGTDDLSIPIRKRNSFWVRYRGAAWGSAVYIQPPAE